MSQNGKTLLVAVVVLWALALFDFVTRPRPPIGRYDFLSIDRTHGLSLAFDTATGRVVALELPGVAK